MPGTVRRLSMKNHHSSGKHRLLKQVIMLCLVLVLVCGISISTFAVNTHGRINRAGQESTQIMEKSRETSVASEKNSQTEQEKEKTLESTTEVSSESQTKKENETTKEESEDKGNKQSEDDSKEANTKEKVAGDNSKKEATKEEKNTDSKKSEETKDSSETETKTSEEKTTEIATEKSTEEASSKEAISEEKATEETQTESDKNKEIAVTSISGSNKVIVGEEITLTGTNGSNNTWSGSDDNIATITGNGSSATVKGVSVGTVTVTHTYESRRQQYRETYQVNVIKFEDNYNGKAAIYYLANPTGDPWTNDTGAWAPTTETSNTLASINTNGATWESGYVGNTAYPNKNIKSNVASYITSWPDGSTGSTWTVKRDDSKTGSYFTFILDSIWNSYKSSVANDLRIDVNELDKTNITEITLTPRKISRDNGGTYTYHIDCALSIKSTKTFTAKFWVKNPGESEYTQVDAKNYLTGSKVEKTTKVTIGSTKVVDGVTYVLDGWYPENASGGAYGNDKITSWNYTPSEAELADGTVNFYAHYSPTTTSIKLKKLVTGNMGDRTKKFHFNISITKENKDVTFKVSSNKANSKEKNGSAEAELANEEEISLTEIPVGSTVTITEDDYTESGYTTSYIIDNGAANNTREAKLSNIQAKEDVSTHEIVFTNHKEAIPDTGITLDSLPFITLLALSIAGRIVYLLCRYKKRFI